MLPAINTNMEVYEKYLIRSLLKNIIISIIILSIGENSLL